MLPSSTPPPSTRSLRRLECRTSVQIREVLPWLSPDLVVIGPPYVVKDEADAACRVSWSPVNWMARDSICNGFQILCEAHISAIPPWCLIWCVCHTMMSDKGMEN